MIDNLDQAIPRLMQAEAIPGLSLALIRDGAIESTRSFGVKKAGRSAGVEASTVFEAASLSKPLFAYGVLRLVRAGRLELDTPLIAYLPDRSFCDDPRLDRITARMVLSHTTGFPNWRRRGKPLTLVRTPGEAFGYSGEGYVYLQEVVEQLTGRPLHEYMDRDVLSPLGMTESSYVWRERYGTLAATGHRSDGRPYRKGRPACGNAAASLHTTPREFARFLSQVLNSRDQSRSESEVDISLMLTPQVHLSGDLWWTLGWGLQQEADDELIWHWGDNPGFKSFAAARLRERRGFVLMMNSDNGIRAWAAVARDVLGMDAEIFDWLGDAFYSNQASRSPAPTRPHRG